MLLHDIYNKQAWKEVEDPEMSTHLNLLQRSKSALNHKLTKLRKRKNYSSEIINKKKLPGGSSIFGRNKHVKSVCIQDMRRIKTEADADSEEIRSIRRELSGIDQWIQDKIYGNSYSF